MMNSGTNSGRVPARRIPVAVVVAGLALLEVIADWLPNIFGRSATLLINVVQMVAVVVAVWWVYSIGKDYSIGQRTAIQSTLIIAPVISALARYTWDTGRAPDFIYIVFAVGLGVAAIA